ncbi:hypothetical protein ARAM_004834 [Aspergillus rambellii]|uniref:Ketose-bisphosphate aldolase class-II family protein n=1 Tax=Aspergillus rambellii TaxID=308745 RepID=A0A0F8XUU1_9EURO|nr:hypothetical protein ARAM_004834 [Aspergillus rambellii]
MSTTYPILPRQPTLAQLPAEYPSDAQDQISHLLSSPTLSRLVILDDDPTGTQTCHDISVLTVWDIPALASELRNPASARGFFILTNSRALPPPEAESLIRTICQNVAQAAKTTGVAVDIVLRGDSTLRGHFPLEADVAQSVFGEVDAWILAPFFFQGGRFTIATCIMSRRGRGLFLRVGRFRARRHLRLHSITIEDIRVGGPQVVCEKLLALSKDDGGGGMVVIVNAAAESDMHVFVAGLLLAKAKGKRYIYRTGAAFVSSRLGIRSKPPITARDLDLDLGLDLPLARQTGGLILAGSYVPKTTAQLKILTDRRGGETNQLAVIEVKVDELMASAARAERVVRDVSGVVKGEDELSSLAIGSKVAEALVGVLQGIEVRPRYIIAKGGITSSDAATKGLRIQRALVVGQAAAGVPLWRCDEPTSRHRGVPFIVFPGNVGSESTLCELVEAWS